MYNKFEKEMALCTYLQTYNSKVIIKLWGDLIKKEGTKSISPYLKGVMTRVVLNASKLEEPYKCKRYAEKESTAFVRKIADFYISRKGEFAYLMKKNYMDTLNKTLPDDLFGDSFLSLVVTNYYLKNNLIKTIERDNNLETYKKFQYALDQLIKFYRKEIIYTEDDLLELITC